MNVFSLNEKQLTELKGRYLDDMLQETEGRGASFEELAYADDLVSFDTIVEVYGNTDFSEDDFAV